MKKLSYLDNVEKAVLIEQEKINGLTLLEIQKHRDGNFLIFGAPPPKSLEKLYLELEARVVALEKKP